MKIWKRFTLMKYAHPDDSGRIPLSGWIGSAALALVVWAAWAAAMMLVRG
jgi:hypothetical protein